MLNVWTPWIASCVNVPRFTPELIVRLFTIHALQDIIRVKTVPLVLLRQTDSIGVSVK